MLEFFKNLVLELIFPTSCINCSSAGRLICQKCYKSIGINFENYNIKVPNIKEIFVASSLNQEIIEKAVYQFKYNFIKDLGSYLSQILIDYIVEKKDKHYLFDIDVVVPVPLSKKRFLKRGFNQSEILARNLSVKFGWEVNSSSVLRKHRLKPQVNLGYQERIKNVENVFQVKDLNIFKDKKVLIIDDVLTTGSTIAELAKILRKSGAKEVSALVLAKNN